jgi:hypothetical protein
MLVGDNIVDQVLFKSTYNNNNYYYNNNNNNLLFNVIFIKN